MLRRLCGCGYGMGVLGLLRCVSSAISFCICTEDVMCCWFDNSVGVVSDDHGFKSAWRCSCARIGTLGVVNLYITSGKGLY